MKTNTSPYFLFHSLLSSAPIGFAIIDKNRKFTDVNEKFCEGIGGKTTEELVGHTMRHALGEALWREMKPHFLRALNGEPVSEIIIKEDGRKRYGLPKNIAFSYFPIQVAHNKKVVGILLRDTTDQVVAEITLSKYRDRLAQAQKAGKIGVFEWDLKTGTVWWSDEEESLFGVPPGTFEGTIHDWIRVIHPSDKKLVQKHMKKSLTHKVDLDVEFRVLYPGQIMHWLRVKGQVFSRGNTPYRIVGVHYDITSRKQNEQLLTFKAEASRALSSSLDYESTLKSVAKLAVEYIADWCVVDFLNEETNEVVLVAAEHQDPKKSKWAWKLREKYPIDMTTDTGIAHVLKTGKSVFAPFISLEDVLKSAKNDEQRALIKKIGFSSAIMVPISIGPRTIGAISFVSAESKRHYTIDDLDLAEQLASRAALAIENARLYQTVKDERERLDELLRNVPGVVWESWGDPVTKAQKITYVSAHAERLLGYPREDWLNKPNFWLTIVHPDDKESAALTAQTNFKTGQAGISRFRWMTKDGQAIWMESQSFVVKDKKGRPHGMRGIVMDISENMEQLRRKDEFISLASHELKTPITTIKAFTQILKLIVVKDLSKEYLAKMDLQINKLTRLISDLLDVSKIQEGKLQLNKESFSLDSFLESTANELQTIIKTHTLKTDLKSGATISADRDRLAQVINNLITNAVKYSPQANEIIISSQKEKGHAVITIQDFGLGIAKKHQDKIFNRFYRIHDNSRTSGLGIGLFISKEIVTRHKGEIQLISAANNGSTFIIHLPTI